MFVYYFIRDLQPLFHSFLRAVTTPLRGFDRAAQARPRLRRPQKALPCPQLPAAICGVGKEATGVRGRTSAGRLSGERCKAPRFAAAAVALASAGPELSVPETGNGGRGARRDFVALRGAFDGCTRQGLPAFFCSLPMRAEIFDKMREVLVSVASAARAASRVA